MADAAANTDSGSWSAINQFFVQLQGLGATVVLAAIGTAIIYYIVDGTVGFRIDEEGELAGLDYTLHGEHGYGMINIDSP